MRRRSQGAGGRGALRWTRGVPGKRASAFRVNAVLLTTSADVTLEAARAAITAKLEARRLRLGDALPIERDSPGNYTLTKEDGRIAFRSYRRDGSPDLVRTVTLRGVPSPEATSDTPVSPGRPP